MNKIVSPIRVYVNKKTYALNLNIYRNANPFLLGKIKDTYTEQMKSEVDKLPIFTSPIRITYHLYVGTKRKLDIANVCCIVDKFFCDTLTHYNKIPEDNYEWVKEIVFVYGGYEHKQERMEITIDEISAK